MLLTWNYPRHLAACRRVVFQPAAFARINDFVQVCFVQVPKMSWDLTSVKYELMGSNVSWELTSVKYEL